MCSYKLIHISIGIYQKFILKHNTILTRNSIMLYQVNFLYVRCVDKAIRNLKKIILQYIFFFAIVHNYFIIILHYGLTHYQPNVK